MIRKIDHVVITTAKPEACTAFYKALGFVVRDAGGRYELIAGDFKINVHILGKELQPHAEYVRTGSADLCIEIDGSIEKFQSDLSANGLAVELGIVARNGVRGPMQSIYLRDPDGNLIEFCKYD